MINSIQKALAIIREDESQKYHLFHELAETNKPMPWLEPLFNNGYFDPSNNPSPEEDPIHKGSYRIRRWIILGYLENVANQNYRSPDNRTTDLLIAIIDPIIDYRKEGKRVENYITDWILVKVIFCLPSIRIIQSHIKFVETALSTNWPNTLIAGEIGNLAIPRLISSDRRELLLELLRISLQYRKRSDYDYSSILDDFWLKDLLSKNAEKIARYCGAEAAEVAVHIMQTISQESQYSFSGISIPALEHDNEIYRQQRYEYQLVSFVRDMCVLSDVTSIRSLLPHLLTANKSGILRRIAVFAINRRYRELKDFFWQWPCRNPLNDRQVKREVYELIQTNCTLFSSKEIAQMIDWIETAEYDVDSTAIKNQATREAAFRKKVWLSALKGTQNADVIAAFNKYDQIAPQDVKPLDTKQTEIRWVKVPEAKQAQCRADIAEKQNSHDVVSYLNDFKEVDNFWDRFGQDDLADVFRDCVKENSERFSRDLVPFESALPIYQEALFAGLREAWKDGRALDWRRTLNFMELLVKSQEFLEIKASNESKYRNRIIVRMAELLEEGTKDDRHAFDKELLPLSEHILLTIASQVDSDLYDMQDLVTSVLNSTQGAIFDSMISYSLRNARLAKRDPNRKWIDGINDHFLKRLNGNFERTVEFSLSIGKYLPTIYYSLDAAWIRNNIQKILPQDNESLWKTTMTGYLFYARSLYVELYTLLREEGHYARALEWDPQDHSIDQALVDHLCIAYLNDLEDLPDASGLMRRLIDGGSLDRISYLISCIWILRKQLSPKQKDRIKPLWNMVHIRLFSEIDKVEVKKEVSNLTRWLSLIDTIDSDIYEWLKESMKYVDVNYNSSLFVEYLLDHAKTTLEMVGKLFMEMISNGVYPLFDRDNIREIVKIMYEYDQRTMADMICRAYKGINEPLLDDIYEEHHKHVTK